MPDANMSPVVSDRPPAPLALRDPGDTMPEPRRATYRRPPEWRGHGGLRLPKALFDRYAWQQDGACTHADISLFFHPDGERGAERARRAKAAVAICASCPVLMSCRDHALGVREPHGVWGGMTQEERLRISNRENC